MRDQHGREPLFDRDEVAFPHSTWIHVWLGDDDDPQAGRHDPFDPPAMVGKTLFPKEWFGPGSRPDYLAAQLRIVKTFRQGEGTVISFGSRWRFAMEHSGVVLRFWVAVQDDGAAYVQSLWPVRGRGVSRVVSVDPIRLEDVRW